MCKPPIVKEREKNAKKLSMKNVLNEQKYHEILQNFKILHTLQSFATKGSSESPQNSPQNDFFYSN